MKYDRTTDDFALKLKIIINKYKLVINTITMDNGSENNYLHSVVNKTKLYNCDAYNSGQKGTLENKHRILRRVIPKSTSIDKYTSKDIDEANVFVDSYYSKVFNIG
jgi:IS30 family transposase